MRCSLHKYLSRRSPSLSGIQSVNCEFSTSATVTPAWICPCTNIKSVSSGEHTERRHHRHLSHTIAQLRPRCLPGCLVASFESTWPVATVCKEANNMVTMPSSRITSRYAVLHFLSNEICGKEISRYRPTHTRYCCSSSGPWKPAFCMTRYG
jgi:hypothetical protein